MGLMQLLDNLPEKPEFKAQMIVRDKKRRIIAVPNEAMRTLHRRLLRLAQNIGITYVSAHGGVKRRSILTNALEHLSSRYFYLLDIRNAYGSVPLERLAGFLYWEARSAGQEENWGSKEEILAFLTQYCSLGGKGLAQGAPASPELFNFYCELAIDRRIRSLCYDGDTFYSRFVDDLTVSSTTRQLPAVLRKRIRRAIERAGFQVHHGKSHLLDRERPHRPGEICQIQLTGVALDGPPQYGVSLPWKFLRKFEQELDKALKGVAIPPKHLARLHGLVGHFLLVKGRLQPNSATRQIVGKVGRFQAMFPQHPQRAS